MLKDYQVSLFCENGSYKPVSCIVKKDDALLKQNGRDVFLKEVKKQGIEKICRKRLWNSTDLKKYGYTKVKVREYNKERIEQENRERYEQIKKERGWT